jgi:hypothetical protein
MKRAIQKHELSAEQAAWVKGCYLLSGLENPFPDREAELGAFKEHNPKALDRKDYSKRGDEMLVLKNGTREYLLPRAKGANFQEP